MSRGLIVFDGENVIPLGGENPFTQIALAERRITHHHGLFQDDLRQQCERPVMLVRLLIDPGLCHDHSRPVGHQREQLDALRRLPRRTAERLAVDAQHGPHFLGGMREAFLNPLPPDPIETDGIESGEQIPKAIPLRRPPREPQSMPEVNWSILQPFDQFVVTGHAREQATDNRRQHGGQ